MVSSEKEMLLLGNQMKGVINGLGCIYNRQTRQIVEGGFYRAGLLEGFAFTS